MNQNVIIIGLDGATFDIIDPMIEQQQLPHIARLLRNGTRGRLLSTIPYATIPAWPSFMTGKNPGKHGVFDFFSLEGGQRRLSNSRDIGAQTLCQVLSTDGKRSIVMNVPGTYPPARINGVVVSGMLTPANAECTSPPEAKGFLDEVTGGYRINCRSHLLGDDLISDVYEVTEKHKTGFLALLNREDWDVALVLFRATDVIAHHFWHRQDVIRQCYSYVDSFVGEITSACPEATFFLISDHGLQGQRWDFHINKWLIDQGYMSIKKGYTTEMSRWQAIGGLDSRAGLAEGYLRPSKTLRFLVRVGVTGRTLRNFMPAPWWNALKRWVPPSLRGHFPASKDIAFEVDWERTQVSAYQLYATESKAIKIVNVGPSSRERILSELVGKLEALRDPETGLPIVRRAYRREELYVGPYLDRAPDIVLDLHDGYNLTNAFFADDRVTPRDQVRGCHHREGIFVACGHGIERGKELESHPSLLDVMPTVLHCVSSAVPDDCDGRVLLEIFQPESEPRRRELQREKIEWKQPAGDEYAAYGEAEQAEIEERLRSLGYL